MVSPVEIIIFHSVGPFIGHVIRKRKLEKFSTWPESFWWLKLSSSDSKVFVVRHLYITIAISWANVSEIRHSKHIGHVIFQLQKLQKLNTFIELKAPVQLLLVLRLSHALLVVVINSPRIV